MAIEDDQPSANVLLPQPIKAELEKNNEEQRLKESVFSLLEEGISRKRWDTIILCVKENSRLRAFGYWFSQDEKKELIPKIYELITRENVDPKARLELVGMLHSLLKKKNTPDLELSLDWRPLYRLLHNLLFKTDFEILRLQAIEKELMHSIVEVLPKLSIHLSNDVTEELLNEVRTYICPFSGDAYIAVLILSHLLPTHNYKEPPVWLEELLAVWECKKLLLEWNYGFLNLFSRLSYESPFCISWGEYMKTLYTHILDVIYPPSECYQESRVRVTGAFFKSTHPRNACLNKAAVLTVYSLTPLDSRPMEFFKKLFHSVETFFHPSSVAQAANSSAYFVQSFTSALARRVCKERYTEDKWPIIPKDHRITDDMIEEFVQLVLPGILPAIYSKNNSTKAMAINTCKHLAYLYPSYVIPLLMDRAAYALETLTEPHQMFSMFNLLRNVWLAITSNIHRIPDSYTYITNILELTVPGIDLNDPTKASLALSLCNTILTTVPLVKPEISSEGSSTTEEPPFAVEIIEEWFAEMLQRVFSMIEHVDISQKEDVAKHSVLLQQFFDRALSQLSDDLYQYALKKILEFVSSQIGTKGLKLLGAMVFSTCRTDPHQQEASRLFFDMTYNNLMDANGEFKQLTTNETIANLYIMAKSLYCTGDTILAFKQRIIRVINAAWKSTERKIVKYSGKMIKMLLRTLSTYYVLDRRVVPPDVWHESEEFRTSPWHFWGRLTDYEHADIRWHIPTNEERDFALQLVNEFSAEPTKILNDCVSHFNENQNVSTEVVQFALLKLQYIYRGASLLIPDCDTENSSAHQQDEEPKNDDDNLGEQYDERWLYRVPVAIGLKPVSEDNLSVTRKDVLNLLHRLCESILQHQEDRPKILKKLVKLLFIVLCYRGRTRSFPSDLHKVYQSYKNSLLSSCNKPHLMPRLMIVFRSQEQLYRRIIKSTTHLPYTDNHKKIVHDLFRLSTFSYCSVRKKSQYVLRSVLKRFPSSVARSVYLKTFSVLSSPSSAEQLKGANHLLVSDYAMGKVLRDWRMLCSFFPSLCSSMLFDDEENHKSTFGLIKKVRKAFYTLPLEYPFMEGNEPRRKVKNADKYENMLKEITTFSQRIQSAGALLARNAVFAALGLLIRSDVTVPQEVAESLFEHLVTERSPMHNQILYATVHLLRNCCPRREQHHRVVFLQEQQYYMTGEQRSRGITDSDGNDVYLDKVYLGWTQLPKEYHAPVLSPPDNNNNNNNNNNTSTTSQLFSFIRRRFTAEYVHKLLNVLADTKDHGLAILWLFKYLTRILGYSIVDKVTDPLKNILKYAGSSDADEKPYMHIASRTVSGILRGCKYWDISQTEKTQQHFLDIISHPMMISSSECTDAWVYCLQRMVHNRDPRRVRVIKQWVLSNVVLDSGTAATQSRSLEYLHAVSSALKWTDPAFHKQCLNTVRSSLSHPYRQVRSCITSIMTSLLNYLWSPARDSKTYYLIRGSDILDDDILEFLNQTHEYLRSLLKEVDDIPSSGGSTKSPEERALKNFVEVFLATVSGVLHNSKSGHLYLIHCLPMLSEVVESTHEEVTNAMPKIVAQLASLQVPQEHFTTLLNFIKNITTGKSWRLRSALVKNLEIILFRQQFNFLNQSEMVKDWMLDLLQDSQVEVRQAAAPALASYLKISDSSLILEFQSIFEKWSKLKKRKNNLKKHAGVLGLGSIVLAYPYEIPSFMPEVLIRLAQHVDDGEPIKTTVYSTFSEFWKSHQDTWHIDKEKFTSEQLHKLTELIVSPTYFA